MVMEGSELNMLAYTSVTLVLFAIAFAVLVRRLLARVDDKESCADWLGDFSVDAYKPMERLLNEADYRFLAAQPGYRRDIVRQLKAERKAIFRTYLRQLVQDFNQLVHIANLMLVYSEVDRPEFARSILSVRFRFYKNVMLAELSLGLSLPMRPVKVDALIGALQQMRGHVVSLAPR